MSETELQKRFHQASLHALEAERKLVTVEAEIQMLRHVLEIAREWIWSTHPGCMTTDEMKDDPRMKQIDDALARQPHRDMDADHPKQHDNNIDHNDSHKDHK